MAKLYTVVYRTGGYARYQWHRALPQQTLEQALRIQSELERAGYHALAPQDAAQSMRIGLPETFEPGEPTC